MHACGERDVYGCGQFTSDVYGLGCAAVDSFHPMEAARKMYKSLVRFRAKFDAENK